MNMVMETYERKSIEEEVKVYKITKDDEILYVSHGHPWGNPWGILTTIWKVRDTEVRARQEPLPGDYLLFVDGNAHCVSKSFLFKHFREKGNK